MKIPSLPHSLNLSARYLMRRLLVCVLCATFSLVTAYGGTATKQNNGVNDVASTDAGVWSGGSGNNGSPTTADIATWSAVSSTGAHTCSGAVNWGSMSLVGNTNFVSISGSDITLAAGGANSTTILQNSTQPLTIGNNILATAVNNGAGIAIGNTSTRIQFSINTNTIFNGNVTTIGGTATNDVNLTIRGNSPGIGTINGTLTVDGQLFKGDANTWVLNGANTASWVVINNGGLLGGNNQAYGAGTIYLSSGGGNMTLASADSTAHIFGNKVDFAQLTFTGVANFGQAAGGTGAITFGELSLGTANRNIAVNNANTIFTSVTGTTGGITKSGAGTLTISGANTYTGATTNSAGTLKVSGGSLGNTPINIVAGTFAVQPGNTTTINIGTTTIAAAGAKLNLSTNTFDMTDGAISTCNLRQASDFVGNALTIASGATLKFNLGNTGADLLAVTKSASVSGTVNVTIDTTGATALTHGGNYNLITAASGLTTGSPTWQFTGGGTTKLVSVGGNNYNLTLNTSDTTISVTITQIDTVTYDGNGSDGGAVPVDGSSPYVNGATVTVLDNTGGLTKSGGNTFSGWNTAADGTGTPYVAGNTFTIATNTTLYAQWLNSGTVTVPATFPGAVSTIYGTASSPQSVSISGASLTANITATAPVGLEVSSDGSTYGATAIFTQSGGNVSGTLYVRLAATAQVSGNPYNSKTVVLISPGVVPHYVATTASGNTVTPLTLTLTGAAAQNKLYDGSAIATIVGGTLNTPVNGDLLVVTNGVFVQSIPGTGIIVTNVVLSGAAAGNYTLIQPAGLTADIVSAAAWINPAGGLWGTAANWTNNLIPNSAGGTADFSTLDITADTTVNLNSARTIGSLIFGDTDTTTPAGWTLANNGASTNILTLAGPAPTVAVNALDATKTVTISAVVAGTSGLTKTGTGTLTLAGVNTYTGNTIISGGNLAIGGAGQLGSGSYTGNITNNAILTLNSSASQSLSGVISGSGTLTSSGSGTLSLSGNNSYSGGTSNLGGFLVAINSQAFGTGPVTVDSNAVATTISDGLTVTNDFILNGGVGQYSGLLVNSGAGNATLSGGTITINGTPQSGGHFASVNGGTLTVADPVNSDSTTVTWRNGTGIFSGGGSYGIFNLTGTVKLGANNGLAQNATIGIGFSSAGTLDLAGFNQTLAGINKAASYVAIITNSSTTTASTLTTTGISTYAGSINNGGGAGTLALTVNGGQLTITGTNTYTGGTTLASGILTLSSPEIAGTQGPLGKSGPISFTGGTLQYGTANAFDYSPRFSTAARQAYNIDTGGQSIILANALTSSGGSLTVADSTYSTGSLILSGANTYAGATTVNAGKLYVNGSLNAASAVSAIGGAATFGGQGSVGVVTVSSGGTLEGGQGGVGALTLAGLTFTDSANVLVAPNATVAPVKVTTSNGLNPSGGAGTITINIGGSVLAAGVYHLIQYSGSIQGSGFGAFQLGTTPGGSFTYALVNNAGYVDLQVTALADVWTGAFSSEWSLNAITSPKNWTVAGTGPIDYADGQDVLFDDSATGTTVAISTTDVAPNSLIFNNSTKDYTLQGNHAITGGIGLQKYGPGTVTINNTNAFTGDVTINAGTVAVSDIENGGTSSPLGAGYNINLGSAKLKYTGTGSSSSRVVNLSANGTIEVTAAPATLTLGAVNSTAVLTKAGSGTLELSGDCAYTGNAAISAGTLMVDTSLGDGSYNYAGNITNNGSFVYGGAYLIGNGVISGTGSLGVTLPGGQLTLNGVNTYTGDTTISGSTLFIGGTGQLGAGAYAGNIINNGTMNYSSSATQNLSGAISGTGSLTKPGTGTVTLSGTNSYTGGTTITAGTLNAQNNQSAAIGGWSIGIDNVNSCTVNFAAGSAVAVANGYQIVLGNGVNGGPTGLESLNVAGTVTNSGLLNVGRNSTVTLNAGAIWNQIGDLILSIGGGYPAALNINSNASFAYFGTDLITVNGGTTGASTINVDGTGTFLTGAGFVQINIPTTSYGRISLSNGGTLRLASNVANLTTQVQFNLSTNDGVIDNNGYNATLSGTVTVGGTQSGVFGAGNLVKKGSGTLTLTGTNTYTGNTVVNAGTLALAANSPINSSKNIVIAGGATLDVSTIAFGLLSSQTLSNSTSTAILNGSLMATSGVVSLTYASGTPAFTVNNGTLTIATNTVIKVNNTGTALATGSYKLISAGTGGAVSGTAPSSVAVGGNGLASGTSASLQLTNGELYVAVVQAVNTTSPVLTNTVSGNTLTLSWPTDHLGWHLQAQTNSLTVGLGTNWVNVPGSDSMTSTNITINPTNPTVFYRLVYP